MEKKHYIIIIIILIALNIVSWSIWWKSPKFIKKELIEQRLERKRGMKGRGMGYFEEKLELSVEQKQDIDQLERNYFNKLEIVKDSMNKVRKRLINTIGDEAPMHLRSKLFEDMATYKLQVEKLTIEHFNEMRRVCDDDQKKVFDTLMVRMIEHSPMFKHGEKRRGRHKKREERHPH